MGTTLRRAMRRLTRTADCFDYRPFHTFVRRRSDEHGNGVAWWCDYCGDLFDREPTADELAMKPGVSP